MTNLQHWKITLNIRILKSLTRLFIILESLTMIQFSDNMIFLLDPYVVSCPARTKKSWTVSLAASLPSCPRSMTWIFKRCKLRNHFLRATTDSAPHHVVQEKVEFVGSAQSDFQLNYIPSTFMMQYYHACIEFN